MEKPFNRNYILKQELTEQMKPRRELWDHFHEDFHDEKLGRLDRKMVSQKLEKKGSS